MTGPLILRRYPNAGDQEVDQGIGLPDLRQAVTNLIDPRNGAGIITRANPSAWGNGSHDDTDGVNATTAWVRTNGNDTTNKLYTYGMDFTGGKFNVRNVDLTLFRSRFGMKIFGGNFLGNGTSGPVVDMTGSSNVCWFGNPVIRGVSGLNSCGLQLARANISSSFPGAGTHSFFGLSFSGIFLGACLHNFGSEVNNFYGGNWQNSDTTGNAYVVIVDGYGSKSPTSAFTTIATPLAAYSCMINNFWGVEMQNLVLGAVGYFARANSVHLIGCYGSAEGPTGFDYGFPDSQAPSDMNLEFHLEASVSAVANWIRFQNGSAAKSIKGLRINEHTVHVTDALLARDSTGVVTINGGEFRVSDYGVGFTPAAVDDATKFKPIGFGFDLPSTTNLPTTASFPSGSSGYTKAYDRAAGTNALQSFQNA